MRRLGTKYCLKCGKPSVMFAGHLKAKERMALGNLVNVRVGVGWCSEECHDTTEHDEYGCYGTYDNSTMELIDIRL